MDLRRIPVGPVVLSLIGVHVIADVSRVRSRPVGRHIVLHLRSNVHLIEHGGSNLAGKSSSLLLSELIESNSIGFSSVSGIDNSSGVGNFSSHLVPTVHLVLLGKFNIHPAVVRFEFRFAHEVFSFIGTLAVTVSIGFVSSCSQINVLESVFSGISSFGHVVVFLAVHEFFEKFLFQIVVPVIVDNFSTEVLQLLSFITNVLESSNGGGERSMRSNHIERSGLVDIVHVILSSSVRIKSLVGAVVVEERRINFVFGFRKSNSGGSHDFRESEDILLVNRLLVNRGLVFLFHVVEATKRLREIIVSLRSLVVVVMIVVVVVSPSLVFLRVVSPLKRNSTVFVVDLLLIGVAAVELEVLLDVVLRFLDPLDLDVPVAGSGVPNIDFSFSAFACIGISDSVDSANRSIAITVSLQSGKDQKTDGKEFDHYNLDLNFTSFTDLISLFII